MSNPYQSPSYDPKPFQEGAVGGPVPSGFGWVNQVRIVAILNCVQGGLEVAIGLLVATVGGVIWVIGSPIGADGNPFENRADPDMPP